MWKELLVFQNPLSTLIFTSKFTAGHQVSPWLFLVLAVTNIPSGYGDRDMTGMVISAHGLAVYGVTAAQQAIMMVRLPSTNIQMESNRLWLVLSVAVVWFYPCSNPLLLRLLPPPIRCMMVRWRQIGDTIQPPTMGWYSQLFCGSDFIYCIPPLFLQVSLCNSLLGMVLAFVQFKVMKAWSKDLGRVKYLKTIQGIVSALLSILLFPLIVVFNVG